jgi:two-component system cell cycle response regulator
MSETASERRGPDRPRLATVLVVDDSSTTRRILRRGLEGAGYLVMEAADGEEGLAACRAQQPDLVLLDVDMPVLDGLATLKQMQADPVLQDLPVLFLTARTAGNEAAHGLELGAEDYLKKPCDPAELVARVGAALRKRDREGQLRKQAQELGALSSTDPLTGLGNRRQLQDRVETLSLTSGAATPIGVVLLDIDHFKLVNDTHGHATGDTVLAIVARRLGAAVGEDAALVRWGGEEFLALMTSPDALEALAESMRAAVGGSPMTIGESAAPLHITVSAGAAAGTVADFEAITREADAALYRAKAAGRNQVALA